MGPIFPTSVGLASMIAPRIAGTAMSWVMGVGFAGLLLIPPAVGYVSDALGEGTGNLRAGLFVVVAAAITMAVLHVLLALRERRRLAAGETALAREEARAAGGA
jgi:MFS family permease